MTQATMAERTQDAPAAAPTERGWGKLLLALAAFVLVPSTPHLGAVAPVQATFLLLIPAIAACALVGWWAGGRALPAVAWVALSVLVMANAAASAGTYGSLARGWALLLAGAFGLVCLFGYERPFFARALLSLTLVLVLVLLMGVVGSVSAGQAKTVVAEEFARRNASAIALVEQRTATPEWRKLAEQAPVVAEFPAELRKQLGVLSGVGAELFPALLALESLCALALAWAIYHRLARQRLGAPLGRLRQFRFNDQLVWGLIVGLTILFVPTLAASRPLGRNLVLFFGALYMLRGLGVLTWFTSPRALGIAAMIGTVLFILGVVTFIPSLVAMVVLGLTFVAVVAMGLGLGDTWADWRNRARPTT